MCSGYSSLWGKMTESITSEQTYFEGLFPCSNPSISIHNLFQDTFRCSHQQCLHISYYSMPKYFLPKMPEGSPLEWQRRGLILGGTETLPSIYAMNQQKPKWKHTWLIFTPQFYITDVNYTPCNSYLKGQPCSSTSHHECCLPCHSSTLHPRQFRFKTDVGGGVHRGFLLFWVPEAAPSGFRQEPVSAQKQEHKSRCLRERKREGKERDCLFRRCWPLHLLSFTMKATFGKGQGNRDRQKELTSLPQHLDRW